MFRATVNTPSLPLQSIAAFSIPSYLDVVMARHLAVHKEAKKGDVRGVITYLHDNPGIDPDVLDSDGKSALWTACLHGYYRVARVLLRGGADANLKCGRSNSTPLQAAASTNRWIMLRLLVEAGADLYVRTKEGFSVHHFAVLADSPDALWINAAADGQVEVVRFLCDAGADVSDRDTQGGTALIIAAAKWQLAVVRLLSDAGANLSDRDGEGWTVLMTAAGDGHLDVVRFLCDAGADLSACDDNGRTTLTAAATTGHLEVVRFLIHTGADLGGETAPLHAAAYGGYTEIVQELISAGVDVNHTSPTVKGMTAIHLAVCQGHIHTTCMLLLAGSLETATDDNGCRPVCIIGETWAEKHPEKRPGCGSRLLGHLYSAPLPRYGPESQLPRHRLQFICEYRGTWVVG